MIRILYKRWITVLLCLFSVLSCWLRSPMPALAANDNFATSLTATYTIQPNGQTLVEQTFTIRNLKPTTFVTKYSVELSSPKLQNLRVTDSNGNLPAQISSSDRNTSIDITFADKVVGEGKTRTFSITFLDQGIAVISGQILEVYIPKLLNAREYEKYQVIIKAPAQFGSPTRVYPSTFSASQSGPYTTLTFAKPDDQAVTALFGTAQYYSYVLQYELANPTSSVGIIQLALPPDTAYQKMLYDELSPPPKVLERDDDGNWIATYQLAAEKDITVKLVGRAEMLLEPKNQLGLPPPSSDWLKAQPFWETQTPELQELAQKLPSVHAVYEEVVKNLKYDYRKLSGPVERLGAAQALQKPYEAICQEFTDLFITLARIKGVPARRATGYAYTQSDTLRPLSVGQDVLHAWPEYYDQSHQQWIPVDPTWGNTTGGANYFDQLDFHHLVFTLNGRSSSEPHGAGSYRREGSTTQTVDVQFGERFSLPELAATVVVQKEPFFTSLFRNRYLITITNRTGTAWYQLPLQVKSDTASVQPTQTAQTLDYLLPFQTRTLVVDVTPTYSWQPHPFTLTLSLANVSSSHALSTGITYQELIAHPQSLIGLGGGVVIIAIITWGVLVSRRPRQRPLRR